MDVFLAIVISFLIIGGILFVLFEYRVRQPDIFALYESKARDDSGYQISLRTGLFYPRHFTLVLKRTTNPLQMTIDAIAAGNLGVRVKLAGSFAPSLQHIQSLIRVGGWSTDAVAHAAGEAQVLVQGLVKEYTERSEISAITSTGILDYLNEHLTFIMEKFGVELITLAVQSLEPADPAIADALRQQEQARLFEQTERLNQLAQLAAAKSKYQADHEIAEMEHVLDMKKAELKKALLEKESELARQRIEDELFRNRMRLAFEKEELEALKACPELLMLTPQAARLAEASQNLRNARTVISVNPQELIHGSDMFSLFQDWLQKAIESKKDDVAA